MIDLRYHIYSLAAVFLALALGIAIGACVAPGKWSHDEMARRQAQIRQLESRFDSLRQEISERDQALSEARLQIDDAEKVCQALLPIAVKGRLAGRNVALIQTGGSDEAVADVRTVLEHAGAKVTALVKIEPAARPDGKKAASAALALGLDPESTERDRFSAILSMIAEAIVWARGSDRLSIIEQHEIITVTGQTNRWNRLVVVVGGADAPKRDRSAAVDAPLAALLRDEGAEVVGCERSDAKVSYVPAHAGNGISTVDSIDRAAGQIGLIYALCGERGHFGIKRTSDRLIPRTLERLGS